MKGWLFCQRCQVQYVIDETQEDLLDFSERHFETCDGEGASYPSSFAWAS